MNYKTLFNRFLPVAYLSAALCVVAGCEQKEDIDIDIDDKTEGIVFRPTLDGQEVVVTTPQTRVADIDLKTFGFTVCGYQSVAGKFDDKKAQATPNVFAGKSPETGGAFQVVNYMEDKKKFVTPERPWVVAEDDFLSFFAWSDNGPTGTKGITEHSSASATGYPTVNISVCDKIVDQPDIVVAQAVDLRNNALISAIDLQFKHILSKISFKGYTTSGTSIAIKKFDVKYNGTTKSKATYSFDPATSALTGFPFTYGSSVHGTSTYYPVSSTAYPSVLKTNSTPATAVMLGSMMQIPQDAASGFITVRVTYSIEGVAGVAGPEQTRDITIPGMTLEVGHHYSLAFDFVADRVQVSVNSVADWNEMTSARLPLVAGPRGDVMLWLDGGDGPYTFNGEQYWLDRSGYNRHCKIVKSGLAEASVISYNTAEKSYCFTNNNATGSGRITSYIEMPRLGDVDKITVQLLLKQDAASNGKLYQSPFIYTDQAISFGQSAAIYNLPNGARRQLSLHAYELEKVTAPATPTGGVVDFDYNYNGIIDAAANAINGYERLPSDLFSFAQMNVYSLLTARRKDGFKAISRNASNNKETTTKQTFPAKLYYGYLGGDFYGNIKMVKIINRSIEYDQIESDYAYLKKLHTLPDDPIVPLGNLPSNKTKLIAYFDGSDAPYIISSEYYPADIVYWRDRTGNGNHLQIYGYNKGITYDPGQRYYIFGGNNKEAYMKFIKSFGALKDYWIEFGLVNDGAGDVMSTPNTTKRVLVHCTAKDGTTSAEDGFIWYFPNENNNLWAFNGANTTVFDDAPSSRTLNAWGIGRSGTQFYVDRNGTNRASSGMTMYAPKLDHCYIGIDAAKTMPFKGKIKTIRVYSRSLSQEEVKGMASEVFSGIN